MSSFSTEFKVGVFVLAALAVVIGSWMWSYDGVRADEDAYTVFVRVESADGIWAGTAVRLAGVDIGAVETIQLDGDRALLTLRIRSQYELPADTKAQLKATGILGEYFVRMFPGEEDALLQDGGFVEIRAEPGDIDQITRQVQDITEDISAITDVLRQLVEDRANQEHVSATLANIDALTLELRLIAEQNHGDINAIADSVRRLVESLEGYTDDIALDVDQEIDRLQDVTETLQGAMDDIQSITGKVDRGEGTIGALINDRSTIDAINDTIDNANAVIEGFSGLHAEVYYTGRYYMGTQPNDPDTFFYGNPLAGSGSNTLGVRLRPQEDFWWNFEVNDYPQGVISKEERYTPATGEVRERWYRKDTYRFTFQMNKRWGDFALRLGVKENGGGVGVSWWSFKDRLELSLDVFDFSYGSYPSLKDSGIPNIRLAARVEPVRHIYFEGGAEQIALGIKYRYFTGYLGGGFYFTDDDIKLLLATLPLNF